MEETLPISLPDTLVLGYAFIALIIAVLGLLIGFVVKCFKKPEPISARDEWRAKVIFQRHFDPKFSFRVLGRSILTDEVLVQVYRCAQGTFHSVGSSYESHHFRIPVDPGCFGFIECFWSRTWNYLRGTPYKACDNCGDEKCPRNGLVCYGWKSSLCKQPGWTEPTEPMPAIETAKAS